MFSNTALHLVRIRCELLIALIVTATTVCLPEEKSQTLFSVLRNGLWRCVFNTAGPPLSVGSEFTDSTNHGSKILKKTSPNSRKLQKAKLEFATKATIYLAFTFYQVYKQSRHGFKVYRTMCVDCMQGLGHFI